MPTRPIIPITGGGGDDGEDGNLQRGPITAYTSGSGGGTSSANGLAVLPDGSVSIPGARGALVLGDSTDALSFFGGTPSPKVTVIGDVLPVTPPINNPVDLPIGLAAVGAFATVDDITDVDARLADVRTALNAAITRDNATSLYLNNLSAAVNSLVTSFANAVNILELRTDAMERYNLASFPDA